MSKTKNIYLVMSLLPTFDSINNTTTFNGSQYIQSAPLSISITNGLTFVATFSLTSTSITSGETIFFISQTTSISNFIQILRNGTSSSFILRFSNTSNSLTDITIGTLNQNIIYKLVIILNTNVTPYAIYIYLNNSSNPTTTTTIITSALPINYSVPTTYTKNAIGCYYGGGNPSQYLSAIMYNQAIYNRSFTSQEISSYFSNATQNTYSAPSNPALAVKMSNLYQSITEASPFLYFDADSLAQIQGYTLGGSIAIWNNSGLEGGSALNARGAYIGTGGTNSGAYLPTLQQTNQINNFRYYVQFNGTGNCTAGPGNFFTLPPMQVNFTGYTILFVAKIPSSGNWDRVFDFSNGGGTANDNIFISRLSTTQQLIIQVNNGSTNVVSATSSANICDNTWRIYGIRVLTTNKIDFFYNNGSGTKLIESFAYSTSPTNKTYVSSNYLSSSNRDGCYIARSYTNDSFSSMNLGEFMFFRTTLTDSAIKGIISIMEKRWNIDISRTSLDVEITQNSVSIPSTDNIGKGITQTNSPTTYNDSSRGYVLSFNSLNYITFTNYNISSSYTKMCWIKANSLSGHIISSTNISSSGIHYLWFYNGTNVSAGHSSGTSITPYVTDNTPIVINKWVHYAVVYDNTTYTMILYRNGQIVSQNTNITMNWTGGSSLTGVSVGSYGGTNGFNGYVDKVRIYSRAITQNELQIIYNAEDIPTITANSSGNITNIARVTLPSNPVTNITSSGYTLNWNPGGYTTINIATYMSSNLNTPIISNNGQSGSSQVFTNLTNNINYSYTSIITPLNILGSSSIFTKKINGIVLLPSVIVNPASNISATTVQLSWSNLPTYSNLIINWNSGVNTTGSITYASGLSNYSISTGLTPNTSYLFSFSPYNVNNVIGTIQTSSIITFGTVTGVSAGSYQTDGSGFIVSWNSALTWNTINITGTAGTYTGISSTSQSITGLTANTGYTVNVYPVNNAGVQNTPGVTILTPVTYATVTGVAAGTYLANGTGFTVSWTSSATWFRINITGTAGTFSTLSASSQAITGLTANTGYTVNVYPINSLSVQNTSGIQTITPVTYATVTGVASGTFLSDGTGFTVSWTSAATWSSINITGTAGGFIGLTASSQAMTGLSPNTAYTVNVYPVNSATVQNTGGVQTITPVTYAIVTGVSSGTFLSNGTGFTVSWTSAATWSTINITGTAGTFSSISGTSQAITGLTANTGYTVNVYPVNSATIQNTGGLQTITPITNATVAGVTSGTYLTDGTGFTVSWNNSATWTTINITGTAGTFSSLSGTSQAITGLSVNTSYTVNVYAVNSATVQNTAGVTILTLVTYATVGNASTANVTTSSIDVSWSGGSYTNVNIYATGGSYSSTLLYSNLTGTSQTISGLTSGTSYTFTVIPNNSIGVANNGSAKIASNTTSVIAGALYTSSNAFFNSANTTNPNTQTGPTLATFQSPPSSSAYNYNSDLDLFGYYTPVTTQTFYPSYWSIYNSQPGYQLWTVPQTGRYTVVAAGAPGGAFFNNGITGRPGGLGAVLAGSFNFTAGQQLIIQIGQTGRNWDGVNPTQYTQPGRGGGGYTSIVDAANTSVPLLVAAGGGGGGWTSPGQNGQRAFYLITSTSTASTAGTDSQAGTNTAGAGWGQANANSTPGQTWANICTGGTNGVTDDYGGFGGGGAGGLNSGVSVKGGGGGGWIGGNGSPGANLGGLGGYSFCQNSNVALSPLWGSYTNQGNSINQKCILGGMCYINYVEPLYSNFNITFTTCGSPNTVLGPSWSNILSTYSGTGSIIKKYLLPFPFAFKNGYQAWSVPYTGNYSITAAGACGGTANTFIGGRGRVVTATFSLVIGTVLIITVGNIGGAGGSIGGGGGGGMTTVHLNGCTKTQGNVVDYPLICAGGGGGAVTTANGNDAGSIITGASTSGFVSGASTTSGAGLYAGSGRSASWDCAIDSSQTYISSSQSFGYGLFSGGSVGGWGGGGRNATASSIAGGGGGWQGGAGPGTAGTLSGGGTSYCLNATYTNGYNNADGYVNIIQL